MAGRKAFRVIDTGIRGARENIAFDQALMEARQEGLIPDTIRFLQFEPSALVGQHQILPHEVRVDYCKAEGIQIGRRITGGGGLYLDQGQLGWELVFHRDSLGIKDMDQLAEAICLAATAGMNKLGIQANYRPRNDIEVEGRKISGTGGFFDGDYIFYQGTLLIDFDVLKMIEALKIPAAKLAKRDLQNAQDRVVTLKQLLGDAMPDLATIKAALLEGFSEELGLTCTPAPITADEERLAQEAFDEEIGTDAFVYGDDVTEVGEAMVSNTLTTKGGSIRADIRLEGADFSRIREILLTGDFFVSPQRLIYDLEAALRRVEVADAGKAVEAFFASRDYDMLTLTPADFRRAVEQALRQETVEASGKTIRTQVIGTVPDAGDKPTLVFLHDALGCARTWRDFPYRLAKATGLGALVYDRWGSGDSAAITPPYSKQYLFEEALEILPALLKAKNIRSAILVGHSDGGTISLIAAGAMPERIRAVIGLAPHLYREDKTLKTILETIEEYRGSDLKMRLERYHGAKTAPLFERLEQVWLDDVALDWGADDYVRRISQPILALQGADDEFFSPAQLDKIEALTAGPFERLLLEGCKHVPHLQAQKDCLGACLDFIHAHKLNLLAQS